MSFKIKDGVRVGTVDVFNNSGVLLVPAPWLITSRSITITGDASWTVNFDGSTNASGIMTLANTAVTPNSGYNTFTVDSKGRITAASTTAYLTSEVDTLQTVTGRGATSNISTISLTGATASSSTTTGTLVITGGLGVSGAIYNGSDIVSGGNHAINGGTLSTSQLTFNLVNTTATTVNIGGAATSVNIGASTGTTLVNNNLTVTGNLIINGTTENVNSTVTTIVDPVINIGGTANGGAPTSNDGKDRGIAFQWHNGTVAKTGFFGYKNADGYFEFYPDASITGEVVSGTLGDIKATNFRGALIGNASTATTWATGRTVSLTGDVTYTSGSLDGSANVTGTATLANSGVTAGTGYNTFNVDAKGRVTSASTTSYLTAEVDTLATVTGRGATTGTALSLTNTTDASNTTTGALVISGGLAVAKNIVAGAEFISALNGAEFSCDRSLQTTLATTTTTALDSFPIAFYRSVRYLVQITQGSNYQVSEILIIHNGTTTFMTEYAVLESNGSLATFTSDISVSNGRLLVSMVAATSATINIRRTALVV